MLLLARALDPAHDTELATTVRLVANEWEVSQSALRGRANSVAISQLFDEIGESHRTMLAAARSDDPVAAARTAREHQDAFLAGMDRIVAEYEREAREHVIALRRIELVLFALAMLVLALEAGFVFRPAVRALAAYLAQRDRAEQQLVRVSDREQQRLARDLHDGLCQQLIGISYVVKSLHAAASEAEREQLTEVGRLLADAIDQTRGLARGLHSDALDAGGLAVALRDLAVQTERMYGVTCRVDMRSTAEPSPEVCSHLYRIAREAMVNAAKHAEAKTIEIELARPGPSLTLVVRDDGIGIQPNTGDGLGLHMMEYRAKMIGAVLDVSSGARGGTIVTCSLPMPA
jgi:signal transduction histidine kinase